MQVTPADIARMIITAGWLAGMFLVFTSLPVLAPVAVLLSGTGAAYAWLRYGPLVIGRVRAQLRRLPFLRPLEVPEDEEAEAA